MVADSSQDDSQNVIATWNPVQQLALVDKRAVEYSRGFLRSRPERWFPGFAAQWLPLAHSLGIDLKMVEVRPLIEVAGDFDHAYCCSVDDEPIAVMFDNNSAAVIASCLVPSSKQAARSIALEYGIRRFITSLASSWSSGQSSVVRFEPQMNVDGVRAVAGIKLTASVNGSQFSVWVKLGKVLVDKFDRLWRKQLASTAKSRTEDANVSIELAHLTIPPTMLESYLKPGTDIDLEVPVSDLGVLIVDNVPQYQVKIVRTGETFAIEVQPGAIVDQPLPEGTSRLSVQIGNFSLPASVLAELVQPKAMLATEIPVSDQALLSVAGSPVGKAKLRIYQGHLAITVQ